jgi:hypothetical protein
MVASASRRVIASSSTTRMTHLLFFIIGKPRPI